MNELKINQSTISSLEIAEMLGIKHHTLLEKLEGTKKANGSVKQVGIIPILANQNFLVSDYFIEDSYKDNSGKTNKYYQFTKLGCDFIANKFTGEKGIIFTAKYVKRFNEMEKQIQSQPASSLDVSALQAINEAVRIILPAVEAMGIDPVHKSYLLRQMYEKVGICIPSLRAKQDTVLYTKTQIAQKLGMYSEHNRPHAQAVGAILKKLTIHPNDSVLTSYNRQGHTSVTYQYKSAVLQQVKKWIIDNNYPSIIYNCTTEYSIHYKEVCALA